MSARNRRMLCSRPRFWMLCLDASNPLRCGTCMRAKIVTCQRKLVDVCQEQADALQQAPVLDALL